MNQKLVKSLAQVILSLSDEERQSLEHELQKASVSGQVQDLKARLKQFEDHYQMSSEDFYQHFQAGELEDTIDFFEWNTYYETLSQSLQKLADQDGVLLDQFITLAVAEKISALTTEAYLKDHASQGSRSSYEAVLAKVADVAPEPNDLLPLVE